MCAAPYANVIRQYCRGAVAGRPAPNHRRLLNHTRVLSRLTCVALLALLTGCGGSSTGPESVVTPPPPPPTGLLVTVNSPAQLLTLVQNSFKRELRLVAAAQAPAVANDAVTGSGSSTFTTTYTQEPSVDEYDVIKYDGQRLFIAPTRSMSCCYARIDLPAAVAAGVLPPAPIPPTNTRAIRIMTTDPGQAGITETGIITLDAQQTVEGLYLADEHLAALTSSAWWGSYGDSFNELSSWAAQTVGLTIYDTSTPQNLRVGQLEIEGALVASRKTADGIYIVTRHTPTIAGLNYYPQTAAEVTANNSLIDALSVADLLPAVTFNGVASQVLNAGNCLAIDAGNTLAPQAPGHPVLTTVLLLDATTAAVQASLCFAEATSGVYLSAEALYLTQAVANSDNTSRTLVHRFSIGPDVAYGGSASIQGDLYLGQNRDFRISEQAGVLRLVTSEFTGNATDRWQHNLFMLAQNTVEPRLDVIGQLPNSQRPEAIGKPNEDLYGVRFIADRAYLVTFERTDPLYVLDLSNPRDPLIAGALEVTGFSNFLHPVTDNLLLGLGQSGAGFTKLELFDVTDLANPVSRGSLEAGQDLDYSYSPAEYDRHAFSYLPGTVTNDRFAIPVSGGDSVAGLYRSAQRLYLYEVAGKAAANTASLLPNGYLSVTDQSGYYYSSGRSRSVLDGDAVYFVSDDQVYSALWSDPFNQSGPH